MNTNSVRVDVVMFISEFASGHITQTEQGYQFRSKYDNIFASYHPETKSKYLKKNKSPQLKSNIRLEVEKLYSKNIVNNIKHENMN